MRLLEASCYIILEYYNAVEKMKWYDWLKYTVINCVAFVRVREREALCLFRGFASVSSDLLNAI